MRGLQRKVDRYSRFNAFHTVDIDAILCAITEFDSLSNIEQAKSNFVLDISRRLQLLLQQLQASWRNAGAVVANAQFKDASCLPTNNSNDTATTFQLLSLIHI